MERSLVPDVALVKAQKADKSGNLVFRRTARNFNPAAAMAGKITIVEVEEIVETGAHRSGRTSTCPASTCTASCSTPSRKSASRSAPCAPPCSRHRVQEAIQVIAKAAEKAGA